MSNWRTANNRKRRKAEMGRVEYVRDWAAGVGHYGKSKIMVNDGDVIHCNYRFIGRNTVRIQTRIGRGEQHP